MSFDWKSAIGQFAPTVAGLVGGPAAGIIAGGLCKIFGLEPTPENMQAAAEKAAAGNLTGEQLIALRKLESDAKVQLAELGMKYDLETDKLVFTDRDSARNREIKTGDSWTPRILAGFVVLSWVTINGFLVSHAMVKPGVTSALDSNMEPMLMRVLGTLDAALSFVLAYYFGSSAGSSRKDELLHASIPKPEVKG